MILIKKDTIYVDHCVRRVLMRNIFQVTIFYCLLLVMAAGVGCQREKPAVPELKIESLGLSGHNIISVLNDPQNLSTIYAVAHNEDDRFFEIYVTRDHGQTWRQSKNGLPELRYRHTYVIFLPLAIHPWNPGVLLAGTTTDGIYQSEDQGDTWKKLSDNHADHLIPDLQQSGVFYLSNHNAVEKSVDGGKSWSTLATFDFYRGAIAYGLIVSRSNVYALYQGDYEGSSMGTPYYLAASADGGANWDVAERCCGYVGDIALEPTSQRLWLVMDGNISFSPDQGRSWQASNSGLADGESLCICSNPANARDLYAGTTSGLYRSTDEGASWSLLGLAGKKVNDIRFSSIDPDQLYAGTDDGLSSLRWDHGS
jgi:photosystem II stability/assembly factor-like uncharacterized protein